MPPQTQSLDGRAASSSKTPSSSGQSVLICLLHLDLRIADNPLWHFAHLDTLQKGGYRNPHTPRPSDLTSKATQLVPLFVFDEREYELSGLPRYQRKGPEARTKVYGFWKTGAFRTRFAAESVYDLRSRLRERGSDLCIRFGLVEDVVANLITAFQDQGDEVEAVWMEKESTTDEMAIQQGVEERVKALHTPVRYVFGKTLIHPEDLPFDIKDTPDVFTPFRKKVEVLGDKMVRPMYTSPKKFKPFPAQLPQTSDYFLDVSYEVDVDGLSSHPPESASKVDGQISFYEILAHLLKPLKDPNFPPTLEGSDLIQLRHHASAFPFRGGESSALDRFDWYFVRGKSAQSSSWGKDDPPPVARYKQTRNNLLGHGYSTKMSPFLAYGSISARQIWEVLGHHESIFGADQNIYWVKFEMLWRDYFHFVSEKFGDLLYHIGGFELATDPPQAKKKLDGYWKEYDPETAESSNEMRRLLEGRTGIPFIDANIRELRETGFLSNRGRQNLASYLAHDLTYDWRVGAELFESYLIDSAASSINLGNWQYVSGVGNDPRASRRFNIIKQAKDYDSHGEYVKTWLPALRGLPADLVHTPWLLDADERRRYALKTSESAVTAESYPARPLTEDEGWSKHYDRRAGEGSRMHGNPQEKIKDGKIGRGKRNPNSNRDRDTFDGAPRGDYILAPRSSPPVRLNARAGPPLNPSRGAPAVNKSTTPTERRGSGGSSTGGGSGSTSSSEGPNASRGSAAGAVWRNSNGHVNVNVNVNSNANGNGNGYGSGNGNGNGNSQRNVPRGSTDRLVPPFNGPGSNSPRRMGGARPRDGNGSATHSSGEGSGRESGRADRTQSKAEQATSWRKGG